MRVAALVAVAFLLLVAAGAVARAPAVGVVLLGGVLTYVILEHRVGEGAVTALLIGYLADVLWATDRGLHALSAVACFFGIRAVLTRVAGSRWPLVTLVGLSTAVALAVLPGAFDRVLGRGSVHLVALGYSVPRVAVFAIVGAWPLHQLFRRVDRRFRERAQDIILRSP